MPLEATTASPSIDTKRQEKTAPAKRFATRKGSSAENSAIIEKRGMSKKTISPAMADDNYQSGGGKSQISRKFRAYSAPPYSQGGHRMNPKVIITCAVTGAGDTVGKHPA